MGSLILVRHGRTEWNQAGLYQGWADIELDEEGLGQAKAAATTLAEMLCASGTADERTPVGCLVVSSDLRRASATARLIATALGAPVVQHPGLREVNLGAWEGLSREQARQRFPDEHRAWETRNGDWFGIRRGCGETAGEAGERFADGLAAALSTAVAGGIWGPGAEVVVVVAHGLVIQGGLRELAARGLAVFDGTPPHLDNGEILVVPSDLQLIADGAAAATSRAR